MGFLDKRNNKLRIVCAGICVIITVLLSGCSEEGSNINISESVEKYLAESELDGSRLLDINMKDITPLIGKYSETDFDKSVSEKEVQKNIEDILESYAKLKTVKRTIIKKNDFVKLDFKTYYKGKKLTEAKDEIVKVGAGNYDQTLEKTLIGLKSKRKYKLNITVPKTDTDSELTGKKEV